jgi:hypothetical protein
MTILLSIKVFVATSIDQFEQEWAWLILGLFGATGAVDLVIAASMFFYTMKNRVLLKPEYVFLLQFFGTPSPTVWH